MEKKYIKSLLPYGLIAFIALLAFVPGLGSVHLFDWDEINFAEAAREMLVTNTYGHVQINFEPFYEKPPLFFWLQAASMKLWGIHAWGARFPNVVCGIVTLWTIYWIGCQVRGHRFGYYWAGLHFAALLPHFYFKTGIIDPVFNYFIFAGFYCLFTPAGRQPYTHALLGGLALGLATLTKGPVGYLLPGLTIFLYNLATGQAPIKGLSLCMVWIVSSLAVPCCWLGYEIYHQGPAFITLFLDYQLGLFKEPIAGHGQPFYYHGWVLLLGCFPASVLALKPLYQIDLHHPLRLRVGMQLLCWVVIVVFSIATTKIVHYSSLAYFPISFLGADTLLWLEQTSQRLARWIRLMGVSIGLCITGVLIALPLAALYRSNFYSFVHDPFILANLSLDVPWSRLDMVVGLSYGIGMGWAYYFLMRGAIPCFVGCCSLATLLCLGLGTQRIVPKIEGHLQRPAIEFYKTLANQPVYLTTVGFKSYAPFFYANQSPQTACSPHLLPWLLTGPIDKPAYFVSKITDQALVQPYPDIQLIQIVGGFCFFKRDITCSSN